MGTGKKHARFWVLLGLAAGVFLLCFRPIIAFRAYSPYDDLCYLEWAARFVGEAFPRCPSFSFPPGAALLWLPASLFAKGFHNLLDVSFPELLCVGVGLLSFVYWVGSLFLVEAILSRYSWVSGRFREYYALIVLLNIPVLYYATHRSTMVHSPEVFLSLLGIFLLLEARSGRALAVAMLLTSLRVNDFLAIAMAYSRIDIRRNLKIVLGVILGLAVGSGLLWYGTSGHNGVTLSMLASGLKLKRIPRLLFEGGWGLLYTAPAWLVVLGVSLARLKHRPDILMGVAWMAFAFGICAVWWGNGSDFAYRYMFGTYAVALWIALELKLDFKWFRGLLFISSLWIFWLTWIYKEFPETSLQLVDGVKWVQPDLQWDSLRHLFIGESYWRPLLHSPLYALFITLTNSVSPYALPGGVEGLQFRSLVVSTLGISVAGVFSFLKLSKLRRTQKI